MTRDDVVTESPATTAQPFPQQRTCPFDPPPDLLALRERGPVHDIELYDGTPARFVTGYHLGRRLLADGRLSADRSAAGFPVTSPRLRAATAQKLPLIGTDPPAHDVQRRLVNREFALRPVRAKRAEIQQIVDEAVDDVVAHGAPADLLTLFAVPVPSRVISLFLGVPYADHDFFQEAARRMIAAKTPEGAQEAGLALVRYLQTLVEDPSRAIEDGLLRRLATEQVPAGALTPADVVQLGLVILVAGHETSVEMIALSVLALLENPEQLAALRADPSKLPTALEELLRLLAVTETAGLRVATDDIEVDGVRFRAGEGVVISNSVGNRDPEIHEGPDHLDIERPTARSHMGFGYGIHQCLGQSLARLELEIAIGTLVTRFPHMRLAEPLERLPVCDAGTVQGVKALPVTW